MSLKLGFPPNVFNREILPPGFSVYRKDRGSQSRGVMVAVSNHIPSKSIQVQSPCELFVVNLTLNPSTFICYAHVPPSSPTSYLENIAQALHTLPSSSTHLILLGDFNIIDANWSTLHSLSPSLSSFCDHLFSFNMQQIINASTHIQGNTLDLVFSNQPNLFSNLTVSPTYSDHQLRYLITPTVY